MAKTKVVTQKEQKENKLFHVMMGFQFIPEPTYFFNIGDPVDIGSLEDCVVVDILENGKIYEIEYTTTQNKGSDSSYRPETKYMGQRGYWNWLDVRPYISIENHKLIENSDLRLSYSQRDLAGILENIYSFGTDMNPSYQRGYVWNKEDKHLLIDSVFKHMDIGKFVFIHLPYKNNSPSYEILDGKQRLNAISEFYENKFSFSGYYFNDLSHRERNHFKHYMISYCQPEDISEQQKLRYFLTLNRSGKIMDKKHLTKIEKMLE